jgi:hypothetical protein
VRKLKVLFPVVEFLFKLWEAEEGLVQHSGKRLELIIRMLYCKAENKIHHELPDILVPYKRYDAESIEGVLFGEDSNEMAVEESTIYR